jgi:hypothetical protein
VGVGMTALTNDKKRREFIENIANWEEIPTASNFVRMRKILYKEHLWLALDVWQSTSHYNYQKHDMVETTGWELLHYYQINKETHALTWPVSITQIVEEIKDIDKNEAK